MASLPPIIKPPTRPATPSLPGSSPNPGEATPVTTTTMAGLLTVLICFIIVALDRTKLISAVHPLATMLYHWFILLSAFGIVLGVFNVFYHHLRRIVRGQAEWGLSLALVTTGIATLVAGLVQRAGVTGPLVQWIFDAFLAPGAATLYALIFFFMAAALYRYLRITAPGGAWMVAGALSMLLVQMPASANFLPMAWADATAWLIQTPIMATFRGALLGSALALLTAGVRYLLGRSQ
ncbi:MAG: hypothetical protein KDE53_23415 [Caldilineaceae bacterium]|nr:hypothetical protein [Caldilineaceae bacterium]